ncbi:MAG: hypothetical protein ACYTF0_02375 [Planctomycetota bacterium]|jgi:hypothetical protein
MSTCRRLAALSCFALPILPAASVASIRGVERPTVSVRGHDLEPLANFSYNDDRLRLHPLAAAIIGWDSNVTQVPRDETSDVFIGAEVGTELRYFSGPLELTTVTLTGFARDYLDSDARDFAGYRLDGEHVYEGDTWITAIDLDLERKDDTALETGRSLERAEYGAAYRVVRTGFEREWSGGAAARYFDYLEDGELFRAKDRQRWEYGLFIGHTWQRNEISSFTTTLHLDMITYDADDSPQQDSIGGRLTTTWIGELGDRSRYDVELGLQARRYDDSFAAGSSGADDDIEIWPSLASELEWNYREGGTLTIGAYSEILEGITSNAILLYGTTLTLAHRLPNEATIDSGLELIWRDVSSTAGRDDDSMMTSLWAGVRMPFGRGLALRPQLRWRDLDIDSGFGYQQVIASIDGAVVF